MTTFFGTFKSDAEVLDPHGDIKTCPAPVEGSRLNDWLIRMADIFICVVVIAFLAPALLLVAIGVGAQDGGPIFFKQRRLGKGGREFYCYKFRSMLIDSDQRLRELLERSSAARAEWEKDHKLRNDPRVTPFGYFIRKTSLDEFPQLWNVLKGEMSLVGPRPIVQAEILKYGRSYSAYCSVLPGITGLWQVMGRNDVSYRRRVAMDRLFAKRRTFGLYMFILFATIPAVLFQRGVY